MKPIKLIFFALLLLFSSCQANQEKNSSDNQTENFSIAFTPIASEFGEHSRGISMVNDRVAWSSGNHGTFRKTMDGNTWYQDSIPGYTHLDFRDIHAFDSYNALIMAAGDEGRMLRTSDGGVVWEEVYTNLEPGIFLDGLAFDGKQGICYGDPINGSFFILKSQDEGRTWYKVPTSETTLDPLEGEAGFAASGTGIVLKGNKAWIATGGGAKARIIHEGIEMNTNQQASDTPIRSAEGCGIFSIAFKNNLEGVAVGGCYLDSLNSARNCAITNDGGLTWNIVDSLPPNGYRSCVAYNATSDFYLSCGRSGIDYSVNDGLTWTPLSENGYYSCALGDSTGWLIGAQGKIARLSW